MTRYSLSVMSDTESHQRKNSADISSRALEIKLPQNKVIRKTEHGTSRHKNNKVACTEDTKQTQPVDAHSQTTASAMCREQIKDNSSVAHESLYISEAQHRLTFYQETSLVAPRRHLRGTSTCHAHWRPPPCLFRTCQATI